MDSSLASFFTDGNLPALPISWTTPGESAEELQFRLSWTSTELESAKAAAKAQEKLHEARLLRLQQLLDLAKKERDSARQECFKLQERLLLSSSSSPSPSPSQAADDSPCSFMHSLASSPISDVYQSWNLLSEQHVSRESQRPVPLQDWQALLPVDPATNTMPLQDSQQQFSMEALEDNFTLDEDQTLDLAELPDEQSLELSWKQAPPPSPGLGRRPLIRQLSSNSSSASVQQPVQKKNMVGSSECVSKAAMGSSTSPAVAAAFLPGVSSPRQGTADWPVLPLSQVHLPEPPESDPDVMLSSLPEKGKLLQAVMEAGPLLQTLLLAGPLPQWRHPPPALSTRDIPKFSMTPTSVVSLPFATQLPAFLPRPFANSHSNSAYAGEDLAVRAESSTVSFGPNPCSRSRKLRKLDSTGLHGAQVMTRDVRFGAGPPDFATIY